MKWRSLVEPCAAGTAPRHGSTEKVKIGPCGPDRKKPSTFGEPAELIMFAIIAQSSEGC